MVKTDISPLKILYILKDILPLILGNHPFTWTITVIT